jgi:hypothetical protein
MLMHARTQCLHWLQATFTLTVLPDVLLTVKSSPASVALYCNPAWVTVEDENNKIAGPLNAIFQSGALLQHVVA